MIEKKKTNADKIRSMAEMVEEQAKHDITHEIMQNVEYGQWYTFRIVREQQGDKALFAYDLRAVPTEHIRIPTVEEFTVSPCPSVWQRLKKCMRYLRRG